MEYPQLSQSDAKKAEILIVDDNLDNLNLLSNILTQQQYRVKRAVNGAIALKSLQKQLPDLILLDITMPEISGYEVCEQLKQDPKTREIPIIFISALSDSIDKVKAFSVGGVDYVTKPFQMAEVLARVETHLALQAAKQALSEINQQLEERVEQRTAQLNAMNQTLQQEILQRQLAQEQLLHLAYHDSLTHLPNRAYLMEELNRALGHVRSNASDRFAVLFLDCDHFKVINDSLGHLMGDQLLIAVAQRLAHCLPENCVLARLGGDEFMVLVKAIHALAEAEQVAQTLLAEIAHPFSLAHQELFINASLGLVMGDASYEQPEVLLRDADTAMYQAKAEGRSCYRVFNQAMHQQVLNRLKIESYLRTALNQPEQFYLMYQPIIELATGRVAGCEALARWHHPQAGLISPEHFIPIAEDTGLIIPFGLRILEAACLQLNHWKERWAIKHQIEQFATSVIPWKISINLSVKQFLRPGWIEQIDQLLERFELDSRFLKFEITETALMEDADQAAEILKQLKLRQIQLAIDDFGTGYSSLSYLHRFPVDTLKIDRSFIASFASHDRRIVQAAINLAHDLKMDVVAEGIETAAAVDCLKALGCDYGQGYYFAKPLDEQAMGQLLGLND